MRKFLLLYTAPKSVREEMQSATPEDMQKGMKPWMDWFKDVGDKMIDKGMPLTNAMTVTKDEVMPGQVEFVGYSIVEVGNIDAAVEIAKKSPHFLRGEDVTIEVHEMWDMNGMVK